MPLLAIISELIHLARRGTAPRSRQRTMGGPKWRCSSNQRSNAGQPLLADHAATSRKGTVGSTGSAAPSMASATATTVTARHSSSARRRRTTTRASLG